MRVLDLTRVIAGPVCGRTLAVHGADVLLVTGAHLPQMGTLVIDNGRGKLSTFIDLRDPAGRETLAGLTRNTDIFVQGYRPGAVTGNGFAPEDVARLRPGIVYVSLSAYGHEGPWAGRRGFDSLVQNANGINHAEAEAAGAKQPKPLPTQAIDHGSGFLMAFGAMTALARRVTEGGSWHVRVSLAQTGHWIRSLGRIDGLACPDPKLDDVRDRLEESASGFGKLTAVRHAAAMSETPPHWARPSVPLGRTRRGGLPKLLFRPSPRKRASSLYVDKALGSPLRGDEGMPVFPALNPPTSIPFQLRSAGRRKRSNARRSSSDIGRNRAMIAAIATSAARVAPSSHLSAMPRPCSGSAPQNTPSAPVFASTRAPNSFMISVQKRPVPATKYGCAAQAARMRAAAFARSGPSPCPVPNFAKARANAVNGTAQVGIEQPSMPH